MFFGGFFFFVFFFFPHAPSEVKASILQSRALSQAATPLQLAALGDEIQGRPGHRFIYLFIFLPRILHVIVELLAAQAA